MKTTSNGRRPTNIKSGISQQPRIRSYSNFKLQLKWPNYVVQILLMKTTSNEDDLKILKVEYLNHRLLDNAQMFNLSLYDKTIYCKSFKWRRPPMEDDLKILKVEYISNRLLDPTQIFNLSLYDQTILYKSFKWRQPPMVDDLKIFQGEYLSNLLLDPTQIINLSFDDQIIFFKSSKWRWPIMEEDLKILKVEYLSNHCLDHEFWVLTGKLEENSEEITSVALLSPACFILFPHPVNYHSCWIF